MWRIAVAIPTKLFPITYPDFIVSLNPFVRDLEFELLQV